MIEKIYLGLILVFFILAFLIRNIKTYLMTKQSIRGKSIKLTISIIASTMIYVLILLRLTILTPKWIFELNLFENIIIKPVGIILVTVGFILGILSLIAMQNSWRVGIKHDQKTELVTSGVFSISRNPYFLSFIIMIFGYILVFPSILLILLYIILVITFHNMIIEEEKYLQSVHGESYRRYQRKTNRYLTIYRN